MKHPTVGSPHRTARHRPSRVYPYFSDPASGQDVIRSIRERSIRAHRDEFRTRQGYWRRRRYTPRSACFASLSGSLRSATTDATIPTANATATISNDPTGPTS